MFNRVNFMAGKSGSATFKKEGAIVEEKDGGLQFYLGGDEIWTLPADSLFSEENKPVFRVNLAEVPEQALALLEQMQQAGQLEFGIITSADGSASKLNSSDTATGVVDIQQTGNSLQNDTGDTHARAFTEILKLSVETILENMPPNVAWFLEDGVTLATLNREEIRNLDRDVRLLLTKARSAQSLQTNAQATTLVLSYLQLPKASQKVVRPFFINQLRALDVQDADDHLPEPTDAEIAAEQQAAQASQQKPPSDMMSINYKDAPPPIQRQMESAMGMQPLTPVQEQQQVQASAAQQQTKVPAHHLHVVPNTAA